ncbi:MAG: hypothetical protein ACQCN3_01675 [Candidatus Bathyarchaeia archaeon]|jgi:hypothetical protein
MTENTEIFENEEATKFLDYFVAYMKLMEKVDNIKNIATQQTESNLLETQPTNINQINDLQAATVFPIELNK